MESIITISVISIIVSIISFIVANKINNAKYDIYTEKAVAKAKVIEHEAQSLLKEAKHKARVDFDREFKNKRRDLENKQRELDSFVDGELLKIKKDKQTIENKKVEVQALQSGLETQKRVSEQNSKKVTKILENASGLTTDEEKNLMISQVKDENRAEIASIFRN